MKAMSKGMNLEVINKIIADFERGTNEMQDAQAVVGEALDDALADDNAAADALLTVLLVRVPGPAMARRGCCAGFRRRAQQFPGFG
jgi:hypothetical protein